jgi:hypothetical protein
MPIYLDIKIDYTVSASSAVCQAVRTSIQVTQSSASYSGTPISSFVAARASGSSARYSGT